MQRYFALSVIATLFIAPGLQAADAAPGKQVAASTAVKVKADDGSVKEVTLRYLLALPAEYEKKADAKWPLVLFLHGSGERGDDIEKVKIHGPPKLAAAGQDLPYVLVSPQCPTGSRWNARGIGQACRCRGEYPPGRSASGCT